MTGLGSVRVMRTSASNIPPPQEGEGEGKTWLDKRDRGSDQLELPDSHIRDVPEAMPPATCIPYLGGPLVLLDSLECDYHS